VTAPAQATPDHGTRSSASRGRLARRAGLVTQRWRVSTRVTPRPATGDPRGAGSAAAYREAPSLTDEDRAYERRLRQATRDVVATCREYAWTANAFEPDADALHRDWDLLRQALAVILRLAAEADAVPRPPGSPRADFYGQIGRALRAALSAAALSLGEATDGLRLVRARGTSAARLAAREQLRLHGRVAFAVASLRIPDAG